MADADRRTVRSVDSMKVADLAAELQKRGLNKSGKKADLVRRLKKVNNWSYCCVLLSL